MQWGTPLDCTWIIRAEKGKKIYIQFPEYSLKEPNDCNFNFIQIFDEKTDIEHREKNFCGSVADEYMSETDVLFIRSVLLACYPTLLSERCTKFEIIYQSGH